MSYIDKYAKIKPYVKLNIPHNKKKFTKSEKSLITRYYNRLEPMGYFNREKEGYILKDISHSKYRIKNAPRIKATFVNVGTKIIDGKVTTDTTAKIKIINGQINVKRQGMPYKWEFEYNIKKDWNVKEFAEHLRKRMLPRKPKKGQIYVVGAGIYEMRGSGNTDVEGLAKEILKIAGKYTIQWEYGYAGEYNDIVEEKFVEDFMYRIIVYESHEAFKLRLKDIKKKKPQKRKSKYDKIRMK